MKYASVALMLLLLAGCNRAAGGNDLHPTKKEKLEKLILAKVRALPEVNAFLKETPKLYKPDLMIGPDNTGNNYYVQVGISNVDQFRTSYYLVVNPKTLQIYFMDQLCDTDPFYLLTLKQWRHWRNTPEWKKPHIYKHGELVVLAH